MPLVFNGMSWNGSCKRASAMFNFARAAGLLLGVLACAAQAATLEYLATDDMIARSTAIVRGRVAGSSARLHGPLVYTHYAIQVSERLKGPEAAQLDVVVPGGTAGELRQAFPGAPALVEGREYLLFLWTSQTGLTHVIGLSQGLFTVSRGAAGDLVASRPASAEPMLDARSGRLISDQPVRLALRELRARIAASSARRGSQ
jgi:hypothetical protein